MRNQDLISIRFPVVNRNSTIKKNDEQISIDSYVQDRCKVLTTIVVENKVYKKLSNTLLKSSPLWNNVGGTTCRKTLLKNVEKYSDQWYSIMGKHAVTSVIRIVSSGLKPVYINSTGYNFACNVGRAV